MKLQEETGELAWEVLTQLWRARQEKIDNFSNQNLEFEFAYVVLSWKSPIFYSNTSSSRISVKFAKSSSSFCRVG